MTDNTYDLIKLNEDYNMRLLKLYCLRLISFLKFIKGTAFYLDEDNLRIENTMHQYSRHYGIGDKFIKELLQEYSLHNLISTFEVHLEWFIDQPSCNLTKEQLDDCLNLFNTTDVGKTILKLYNKYY